MLIIVYVDFFKIILSAGHNVEETKNPGKTLIHIDVKIKSHDLYLDNTMEKRNLANCTTTIRIITLDARGG